MLIRVERCTNYFRLSFPCGGREYITYRQGGEWGSDYWDRGYATKALNLLESVYGYERKNIRFDHLN